MKALLIILFITLGLLTSQAQTPSNMETLITERQAVKDVVTRIFVGTDEGNWQMVEEAFASKVLLDYTSLAGGEPTALTPREITDSWKTVLPGFQFTQHTISNFQIAINGNEATVNHYGNAQHYLDVDDEEDTWTVIGTYEHHLVRTQQGWKTDRMKFNLKYMDGNMDLPRIAQEKVKNSKNW